MRSTVLGVIVGALAASAVSVMTESSSAVITACADRAKGTMRLADAQGCDARRELSVSWNQVGPTGPMGPTGAVGASGPQGPAGAAGATGATGATGAAGPQGPAGADGAQGVQGPQGPEGPQGPAGVNGLDGAQGMQGPQGVQGPPGPTMPSLAGTLVAPTLSIQEASCPGQWNQAILNSNYIILGPGTYRPVFAGTAAIGQPVSGGNSVVELQVRDALSGGFYTEYLTVFAADVARETQFGYIRLTAAQTYVNLRSRVGTSCGSASIAGSVFFEKVG